MDLFLEIMDGQKIAFTYIPHLDGLRAISVLAILAFHLRPDLLPGGFLGVDVFFIVSGFLITSLLIDEIQNGGRINFSHFYLRRFKRLFPSFILVILLTIISAYLLFDQQKFISVAKTALVSILGISNLYFYKTSSYFDLSSIEKPLLHIWSLSVEEQFYFIWPLLLFTTYKFFLRNSKTFFIILGFLFFSSIYFNLNHPVATFYLPLFRFYEFLIGVGLALFPWRQGFSLKHSRTYFFASIIALLGVFLTLDASSLLPGPISLLFILPIAYLISNGGMKSRLNILEMRFFKYIGKRSYTIYLVHWPIIVFYLESNNRQQLSAFECIILTMFIFLTSHILHRFYELPLRNSRSGSKSLWTSMLTMSLIVVAVCVPTLIMNKKPLTNQRSLIYTQSDIDSGKQLRFSTRIKICESKGWEKCDIPLSEKFNVLIMGDSHAVDALNAMYAVYPDFDYSMSELGGCPPTKRMNELVPRTFPNLDKCVDLNKTRFNIEYLKQFDAIVLNVLFGWYPPAELSSYAAFLKESGISKVIVFGGYIETNSELPLLINEFGFDRSEILRRIVPGSDSDSMLENPTSSLGYFYISKIRALCSLSNCTLWHSNIPFTWDSHHLSFEFAENLLVKQKNEVDAYLLNGNAY
ncbi:COG1835 Predicted acyltransferases [Candidatus Nanopelagicaceae bacterium]